MDSLTYYFSSIWIASQALSVSTEREAFQGEQSTSSIQSEQREAPIRDQLLPRPAGSQSRHRFERFSVYGAVGERFASIFRFHFREREGSAGLFASSRHLQSAVRFLEHYLIRVLHVLRHNAVRSIALEENLPQRYLPPSIFTQKSFSNPLPWTFYSFSHREKTLSSPLSTNSPPI